MTKPTVHIQHACIVFNRLLGTVQDYPTEHQYHPGAVINGREIITSFIVSIDGDNVETQRTKYIVDSWSINPGG